MSNVTKINDFVSREVRAEMARQNLTRQQLAIQLQWSPWSLSRRLKGEVDWTVEELAAVAHLLGVSVIQLAWPKAS